MKILIVSHNYFPAIGGAEKKIKEISERLVKSGEEVTVFCSNAQTTEAYIHPEVPLLPPNSELINGVRVRRFPVYQGMRPLLNRVHRLFWEYGLPFNDVIRTIWNGPIIFNMLPHILKQKTDIIVATPFPFLNMYFAYIAKRIKNVPMAVIPCLHTEDAWAFDRKIMYKILSDTEIILTNTDYERNYLIAKGIEKECIFAIGDGINPHDFNSSNPEEFRKKYDIGNAPVVLFVGRTEKGKGIDTLVDSMSIVWRKFPQAKLIVAGTKTSYSKAIEKKVSSLDARKRKNIILIVNFQDSEKSDLFACCDIFAMPSKVESFGIAYLEAWASGKPVIGCRIGAVASLIEDGKDGLLVEYGNHQELASAIMRLLTSENLRRKLAKNGKKKAFSKYTWDIIAKQFRENLNLTISRGSRKRTVVKRNLEFSDGFGVSEIDRIYLKDIVKRIMRKIPLLFYIAYFIYRKVSNFAYRTVNNDILHKAHFLIKNDLMKLKTDNEALAEEEQERHSPIASSMPTFIAMNMDTQCNLRCIMCIRQKYPQEAINALRYDFKIYEQVADETFRYARCVQLATAGEPLMSGNIREQLRIIKKYSMKLDLVTNATLLNNDDLIKEILRVLGWLHVSIDGATKETYESIRIGAKFEQVIENIRRFNRLREKLYVMDKCRLHFAVVLMKRNIEELPKLIELAKELRVDSVDCSHVTVFHEGIRNESLVRHKELANYYMRAAQKKAEKLNVHLNIPPLFNTASDVQGKRSKNNLGSKSRTCPFLWKRAYIDWSGNVIPCCGVDPPVMGNVKDQPFRQIWNNELYQEMRRRIGTDNPFDCCKHCFILGPSDEESLFHIESIA
jgi:glycosyltransferase involved in cell wall biosynthesis/MoaA/NifB/PqqE/SkfB family radical SAM enzyme